MKKRMILILGLLLAVVLLTASIIIWRSKSIVIENSTTNNSDSTEGTTAFSSQKTVSDILLPNAEDLASQYQDKAEKFDQLISAGLMKSNYQKYDEAKTYFDEALKNVPEGDSQRLEDIRWQLYLLAIKQNDENTKEFYFNELGPETIARREVGSE